MMKNFERLAAAHQQWIVLLHASSLLPRWASEVMAFKPILHRTYLGVQKLFDVESLRQAMRTLEDQRQYQWTDVPPVKPDPKRIEQASEHAKHKLSDAPRIDATRSK